MGLTLDNFETARPGVEDADEGEIVGVGREDAPVEREPLPIAATEGVGQEREIDPVARGKDDGVDLLAAPSAKITCSPSRRVTSGLTANVFSVRARSMFGVTRAGQRYSIIGKSGTGRSP